MKIQFTKHVLIRMQERAVSEEEVYEIFENPVLLLEREEAIVIGRTNRYRFLTLIFDGKRLLTLYPSSRKQRQAYQARGGES